MSRPTGYLNEIEDIVASLKRLGFAVVKYTDEPKAFDNFLVEFSNGKLLVRITRDRSQFILSGKKEDLEPYDLWRAHDDQASFKAALLRWLHKKI